MFPTEAHMNMGGSIHGGAVMSFIDMAMFAGGRCAGMAQGHYVTLDMTTHFLARGQDRCSARRSCGAGEADPQPRLPSRRRQAGRRGLLQLHGHAEAHQREERSGMSGPVGRAYSDLIRAGELKPDPAQERAVSALDRLAAEMKSDRGGLLGKLFNKRKSTACRRLSLGRRRARQVDADGPGVRPHRRPAEAPRTLPRLHARNACSAPRQAQGRGRRSAGARCGRHRGRREAALLRRDGRQQSRRRDDPVTAVRTPARARRARRDHVEPPAARPLQGRAQPRAVPAFHRPDRAALRRGRGERTDRLPPAPPVRRATCGTCRTGRKRPRR